MIFNNADSLDHTKIVTGSFSWLTVRKCQNTYDQKEGDDQDESHPKIAVRISIISADRKQKPSKPIVNMTSNDLVRMNRHH